MILVAVGTQLPFDRMIKSIDEWAMCTGTSDVVAQIGCGQYKPRAIEAYPYIEPAQFTLLEKKADLLVGHAGVGTILSALELAKPLIIMPRLACRGEHRNDHQLATARYFMSKPGIHVANDERELVDFLNQRHQLSCTFQRIPDYASEELIMCLKDFIIEAGK